MNKTLGKRTAILCVSAAAVLAMMGGAALAAPVLQPGVTSAPGMSGVCTNCHTYATPAAAKATSKPAAKAQTKAAQLSRPQLAKQRYKRGVDFKASGYYSSKLTTSTETTLTIHVERRNLRGRWVATPSFNETATLSASTKYKGRTNYKATMNVTRLGRFRVRARLAWRDAKGVAHVKWSPLSSFKVVK